MTASLYAFNNQLTLFNNFTHFLVDPVNGDQEQQHENRWTGGGTVSYARNAALFGLDNSLLFGIQARYDDNAVLRLPSKDAEPLPTTDSPLSYSESDQIHLGSNAVYAQATTHWNYWLRTVLGLREDYQHGSDAGTNHGTASSALLQPKGSLIFTPVDTTEFYVSAGRGFHSNDLRGVNQAAIQGHPGAALIASETGEEIGVRQQLLGQRLAMTLAVFNLDANRRLPTTRTSGRTLPDLQAAARVMRSTSPTRRCGGLSSMRASRRTTPGSKRPLTMAPDIWASTCRTLRSQPDPSMST